MAKRTATVADTAADPTVEFTPLVLRGHTYQLCWDFNAIAEAEALLPGANLLHGIAGLLSHNMTASHVRALLYAALHKAQPKLTLEEAGKLIIFETVPEIRDALLKAYGLAMPEKPLADPSPAAGATAASEPTVRSGSTAGPSDASFSVSGAESFTV